MNNLKVLLVLIELSVLFGRGNLAQDPMEGPPLGPGHCPPAYVWEASKGPDGVINVCNFVKTKCRVGANEKMTDEPSPFCIIEIPYPGDKRDYTCKIHDVVTAFPHPGGDPDPDGLKYANANWGVDVCKPATNEKQKSATNGAGGGRSDSKNDKAESGKVQSGSGGRGKEEEKEREGEGENGNGKGKGKDGEETQVGKKGTTNASNEAPGPTESPRPAPVTNACHFSSNAGKAMFLIPFFLLA
ncbi:T. brucei spp.-specific protein [Trypanosoma brucei gambiense DAL972]|uniref:T. brucei spp.-specific protein n=1 Tax=Trypanosoma brucei gambiense (strain MHOM/CI/86/DAL972) TaxID=679716 RepID=D0A2G4_TRYB9|nr:T. brucei spp.-specific protein [Trypanosoma brucei gambiense DAL972]CBH15458.1 T. brucei spp.-specific protein [Trypanosoma brucei gambiense DAL972]|eukprot:XP_011777722.1 T. brucei spp.-specific protein [Trypanosoma brucei gambiense DAL972]